MRKRKVSGDGRSLAVVSLISGRVTRSDAKLGAYVLAWIDLDEGFRMMSRVEGADPAQVAIGQRVRFRVHTPGGEDDPYPVFVPAEGV